jgi:hypothetical protein
MDQNEYWARVREAEEKRAREAAEAARAEATRKEELDRQRAEEAARMEATAQRAKEVSEAAMAESRRIAEERQRDEAIRQRAEAQAREIAAAERRDFSQDEAKAIENSMRQTQNAATSISTANRGITQEEFVSVAKENDIIYVERTSNPDKFNVRVDNGRGGYIAVAMTRQEIIDRGGEIPVEGSVWGKGRGAAMVQPGQGNTIQSIANELGIPEDQVEKVLAEFKKNPYADNFLSTEAGGTLTPEEREILAKVTSVRLDSDREATLIAEYQMKSMREFNENNIRVGTDNPNSNEFISKAELDRIKATSPELARILLREGFAQYTLQISINKREIDGINALNQRNHDEWISNNIKSDPYLYDVLLTQGEDAAIKALEKRQKDLQGIYDRWFDKNIKQDEYLSKVLARDGEKAALEAFEKRQRDLTGIQERNYITIGGKSMLKSEWEKLDKDYQAIALAKGFDRMQEVIERNSKIQEGSLGKISGAKNEDGSYDIEKLASFARQNPETWKQTLKGAGFDDDVIRSINSANNQVVGVDEFTKRYFMDKGIKQYTPDEITRFRGTPEDRTNLLEQQNKLNREAVTAYRAKYGTGAQVGDISGEVLGAIFPPARALKPTVKLKDISGMEWGIGAFQIALFAAPGVGGLAGKAVGAITKSATAARLTAGYFSAGVTLAAGGVFTADTVKNWDNMTPEERTFSVAMDTAIIGGALFGVGKTALSQAKLKAELKTAKAKIKASNTGSVSVNKATNIINRDLANAIKNNDIKAVKEIGKKLQKIGNNTSKEQGGEIIKERGQMIRDRAGEIVRIAEKRLKARQVNDIVNRIGNNADFVASPSERVIGEYNRLQDGLRGIKRQIESYKSVINKAEVEGNISPKIEKVELTRAQVEARKLKLQEQISKDNATLSELQAKGGEFYDIQLLTERVSLARVELAELEGSPIGINRNKIVSEARAEIAELESKLKVRQSRLSELLAGDRLAAKYGTKIAGTKPSTKPGETRRATPLQPEERGGKSGGTKTKIKTELKTETKTEEVKPDTEKLEKAKEKFKEEQKTKTTTKEETKTTTKAGGATSTDTPVSVPQQSGPGLGQWGLVWENGRIYIKWVENEPLPEGWIRAAGNQESAAEAAQRLREYITSNLKSKGLSDTKTLQKLKNYAKTSRLPGIYSKPSDKTSSKLQLQPQKQGQGADTQTITDTTTATKTDYKPVPVPVPVPVPEPAPAPQLEPMPKQTKTKIKIKTDTKYRDRYLKPDKNAPDKKKQEFLAGVKGIVARRRGELNGKPLYLVNYYPYGEKDKLVMFEKPDGVKEASGPGSVQASATLIRGVGPSKPIFSNTGAVDDIISTDKGNKIKIEHVHDTEAEKHKNTTKNTDNDKEIKGSSDEERQKRRQERLAKNMMRPEKMVDGGDGIVYNPKTGKGHLKL